MSPAPQWTESRLLADVRAADLGEEGLVFRHGRHRYRTTGRHLGNGGMGAVYHLERLDESTGRTEAVVGKTFHSQYLYQLRTDEITRRDHHTNLQAMDIVSQIEHPHLLPMYISTPIADNHLFVSPLKGETLHEAIAGGHLSPRQRVKLLIQALQGLCLLHESRLIHRDFTLRNILLDPTYEHAYLFDFDLAMSLDEVVGVSYQSRYKGRIFGSPGFSVPPEIIDAALMECAITPRLDIYAIGGALFGLFTDQSPHGPVNDMWALLMRIGEGVVFDGVSRVHYPHEVPQVLRSIIECCLERDPGNRYGSVRLVIRELEGHLDELDDGSNFEDTYLATTRPAIILPPGRTERLAKVHAELDDGSVSAALIDFIDTALTRYGYQVRRSLGRMRGNLVIIASPAPELLATGQFHDANTYPKVVTAIHLAQMPDPQLLLDLWFGRYLPVLQSVRRGLFTNLYRVIYDDITGHLFLFSEFVANPRFGTDLYKHDLGLLEALGLGFLIVRQVAQLHEQGLAHNNIRPESLLLRGMDDSCDVHPCMAGLVQPSIEHAAIHGDVRNLASLVLSWIMPGSLLTAELRVRSQMEALRSHLAQISFDEGQHPAGIDELVALIADALSAVDYNFSVLRGNGGDLQEYVLLQVSHRLYSRLWP